MVFGIKFKPHTGWQKKREALNKLHGNQIRILNVHDTEPKIPYIHIFYIKTLPSFDARPFIREHAHDTEGIVCMVPIGGYFIETDYLIIQHRYASTEADDTNQGYAHALEIKNPPKNMPGFVLHGYENNKGHLIFECTTLDQLLRLYEKMLQYGFSALKGNKDVSHSYEIQRGRPWFYSK